MLKKSATYTIILTLTSVVLTGCGSSKTTSVRQAYNPTEYSWPNKKELSAMPPQSQAVLTTAKEWLGVPYKYGGNDHSGVDCSGLVAQVYKDALGIRMPRSSREQHEYCSNISKPELIPGDLIFFATGHDKSQVSHVGIFIGDGLMIHSSASKGVILSDINASYYTRNYVGSGMVDQYHAMIGDKPNRHETLTASESPTIHISQLESVSTGFSLTPVENLPTGKTITTDTIKTSSSTHHNTTTVITTVIPKENPQSEPTVEDARNSVLNAIKEIDL